MTLYLVYLQNSLGFYILDVFYEEGLAIMVFRHDSSFTSPAEFIYIKL